MARRRRSLGPFKHKKARKQPYALGTRREKRRATSRALDGTFDVFFLLVKVVITAMLVPFRLAVELIRKVGRRT